MLMGVHSISEKDTAGAAPGTQACAIAMEQADALGSDIYLKSYHYDNPAYHVSVEGPEDIGGVCNETAAELARICSKNAPHLYDSGIERLDIHGVVAAQELGQQSVHAGGLVKLGGAVCVLEVLANRATSMLNNNRYDSIVTNSATALGHPDILFTRSDSDFIHGRGYYGAYTLGDATVSGKSPEDWHNTPWATPATV